MTEQLIQQLRALRLHGMAASLERQMKLAENDSLLFEERLHLMIQSEQVERADQNFSSAGAWRRSP
jgi:hypothetical protein